MRNEQEILNGIFWPQNKENLIGNLSFSNSADFVTTTNIDISRTEKSLEIFYSSAPLLNPKEQTFFVKLYMSKGEDGYTIDFKKSSPELKTQQDIEDTLDTIRNAIIKMNAKPMFFPTGTIVSDKLKNKF